MVLLYFKYKSTDIRRLYELQLFLRLNANLHFHKEKLPSYNCIRATLQVIVPVYLSILNYALYSVLYNAK